MYIDGAGGTAASPRQTDWHLHMVWMVAVTPSIGSCTAYITPAISHNPPFKSAQLKPHHHTEHTHRPSPCESSLHRASRSVTFIMYTHSSLVNQYHLIFHLQYAVAKTGHNNCIPAPPFTYTSYNHSSLLHRATGLIIANIIRSDNSNHHCHFTMVRHRWISIISDHFPQI